MNVQRMKIALIALATVAGLLGPSGVFAAVDMFLKIDGIEGESTDARNKGSSDVISWSWGIENTATGAGAGGGGSGSGKSCIKGLAITKNVDSATPRLITNVSSGAHAPKAVLKVRKSGADRGATDFFVITMTNVVVSSYQVGGSVGDDRLTESIILNFELVDGVYTKQNADGATGPGIPWNIGRSAGKCA